MKRVLFLMLCLVTSMNIVLAQNRKITGTVVSAEDNEPVIGAAVVVRGTQIGIVTDVDGVFSLEVPASAKTLVISYLGMKTQEVAIKDGLKIILESDLHSLDEVVVTAMGLNREKKSLGYAIQEVKSDELTKAGSASLTSSLSGKVAGVQVVNTGRAGQDPEIRSVGRSVRLHVSPYVATPR